MKKLVFMLGVLALLGSNVNAQRYGGVNPCDGPDVKVFVVTAAAGGIWVSSETIGGGGGGLLCGVTIGTSAANTAYDWLWCASSSPVALNSEGIYITTVGVGLINTGSISSIDSRLMFNQLISTTSQSNSLGSGFKPVTFRNLFCGLSSTSVPGMVYYVPNIR